MRAALRAAYRRWRARRAARTLNLAVQDLCGLDRSKVYLILLNEAWVSQSFALDMSEALSAEGVTAVLGRVAFMPGRQNILRVSPMINVDPALVELMNRVLREQLLPKMSADGDDGEAIERSTPASGGPETDR